MNPVRMVLFLLGSAALALLDGCTSPGNCERWENRTVTRQVCARYSGTHCAHYSTETSTQEVCTRWAAKPGETASTGAATPGRASIDEQAFRRQLERDRLHLTREEIGLPDLSTLRRAIFETSKATTLTYQDIEIELRSPGTIRYLGTAEIDAAVRRQARGAEFAHRTARYLKDAPRHRLTLSTVRLNSAEAGNALLETVREQRKTPRAVPLRVIAPPAVLVVAYDYPPVDHSSTYMRTIMALKGHYAVFVTELREPRPDAKTGLLAPATPIDAARVVRLIADFLPSR